MLPRHLDLLHLFRRGRIRSSRSVWSQLLLAVGSAATIVAATRLSKPYYVSRGPIGQQLVGHVYIDSTELRAPWETSAPWIDGEPEVTLKTPQFLLDRELFAMDLLRTGHVTQARARALADVAVREAYTRKLPPALVLGVMLTENDELKTTARSRVGAIGLMQVYPKPWEELRKKFGANVHTDSTNLKYGIFILGWATGKATDKVDDRDDAWRRALLHYNGCVRGTNTPDCSKYPEIVRQQVQQAARSTCRGADFDHCVVTPMWLARREDERAAMRQH
jgi:soluble lytic murein transglycosylase-like protein